MNNSSEKNDREGKYKPSRREFIKLMTVAGAGALIGGGSLICQSRFKRRR